MLTGAFFGIWGTVWSGHWAIGLVVAMVAGAAIALVHAVFAIHLRADQIVTGTAINFLALGITGYLFIDIYGVERHARLDRLGAEHRTSPASVDPGHRRRLRLAQPDDLDRVRVARPDRR